MRGAARPVSHRAQPETQLYSSGLIDRPYTNRVRMALEKRPKEPEMRACQIPYDQSAVEEPVALLT